MSMYEVKCGDGSDHHCQGTVNVYIDLQDLSAGQLDQILKTGSVFITKEQVELNRLSLDDDQMGDLSSTGEVEIEVHIDNICGACGSDQVYDDEWNNVTAE
ncbi:hypothetical protein [Cellvibrio sp. QJXJ]|uniref:hypothetical protein n=1 Tax=Cellvibrio sp. QJXJ TaxID=2964606 RepID=UPI0021C2EFB7|nr:hypothetical protein [Cellvibrio sp. QJXJ]UUA75254.1 hypothetical protein NNX04_22630 [Cellvibrio sp. QJXJ]